MEAIVPIALLAAVFYLLIVRPLQLRSRRAADLKHHLKPGVEIITTAGLFGRVTEVGEDEIRLEIAPGVSVRMLTGAVGKILTPTDPEPAGDPPVAGEPDPGPAPPNAR